MGKKQRVRTRVTDFSSTLDDKRPKGTSPVKQQNPEDFSKRCTPNRSDPIDDKRPKGTSPAGKCGEGRPSEIVVPGHLRPKGTGPAHISSQTGSERPVSIRPKGSRSAKVATRTEGGTKGQPGGKQS